MVLTKTLDTCSTDQKVHQKYFKIIFFNVCEIDTMLFTYDIDKVHFYITFQTF